MKEYTRRPTCRIRRQQTEIVESDDDDDFEEDIPCADVVAALKLVRKFAQKNNLGNDVASLRNIERELFVQKASNTKQTKVNSFFNHS